jgi:uncharacterized Zn finger protein (UPF0148 family)
MTDESAYVEWMKDHKMCPNCHTPNLMKDEHGICALCGYIPEIEDYLEAKGGSDSEARAR